MGSSTIARAATRGSAVTKARPDPWAAWPMQSCASSARPCTKYSTRRGKKLLRARQRVDPGYSKNKARTACYTRLAERMNIPVKDCHIANFDPAQCRLAIEIITGGKPDA
jgi:hypothetical protein